MGHELFGDLFREHGFDAAADVDRGQFPALALVVRLEFAAFQVERRLFGVGHIGKSDPAAVSRLRQL